MIEQRTILTNDNISGDTITLRAAVNEQGQKEIIAYAALFNSESREITEKVNGQILTFTETISRDAFANTIFDDVLYLVDHRADKLIARQSAKNLEIYVTDTGLMFRAILPDTTLANDLYNNILAGNYSQNSFAFRVKKDEWYKRDGKLYRNILEISQVTDVSTCVNGAYPETFLATRSLDLDAIEDRTTVEIKEEGSTVSEDETDNEQRSGTGNDATDSIINELDRDVLEFEIMRRKMIKI